MNITVERKWFTPNSTSGEMSLNGNFCCYTLEPRADRSNGKPYCIPAGTYPVTLAPSPRFNTVTPHVTNVPGFEEIEIHYGNYPRDTEGCCLVGATRDTDFVGNSRNTFFNTLMPQLQNAASITITYVNAAVPAGSGPS